MSFTHLHVHSQFSLLDSTASIKALAQRAREHKMQALALTDQGNLYGAVEFFKACKGEKIKPILGCQLYVAPGSLHEKKRETGQKAGYPIILLAKTLEGYQNLCKLSSYAHLEGFYYTPRIDKLLLQKYHRGLICLSGTLRSKIGEYCLEEKEEALEQEVGFFYELFKEDFYFELQSHRMSSALMQSEEMDKEGWLFQAALDYATSQDKVLTKLKALSKKHSIACVATNEVRYLERRDWKAHEILMNIGSGEPCEIWERDSEGNAKAKISNPKRKVNLSHEFYFKSQEEMHALFKETPEALEQTLQIADKCQFEFDFESKFYPVFVPPSLESKAYTPKERFDAAALFLKELCTQAIVSRYDAKALNKVAEQYPGKDPIEVVRSRLAYELELIISKGLCDYLLIVYDFISWAKKKKIPVGPGRGSGAGSIVCYLTGITDIEPLRFNLFFERFINPERISYPDIDVDICMERRGEVIDYTVQKYGIDKVAQIITFGTMKAKMAVKDVGRILSVPLSKVNQIAKLIPEDPTMTLDKALEMDKELKEQYASDEEVRRLFDFAKVLEGCVRNTGIHAAGLIISADPLMQHIPVCHAKDSKILVTQYAMKPVEAVGLLKIDFLGLKTLTAIQLAVDAIEKKIGKTIDWVNLELDDIKTFDLLNQGKTLGVFQLESTGMQELAQQLHIDKFEEIIAVGALYRPGPMEMIPSFVSRKHGREPIVLDHPRMKEILEETYGIMVYQEQVMMLAQKLAGYSLSEGDVLRRAMGKKDKEEMSRQREKFSLGAEKQGIDKETACQVFDKIEKFASYGFNKSHAAAYGYLSYVTAYLKANYPMDWMAALMTTDRDDLSKVTKIIHECDAMGIAILPPDVNESREDFVSAPKGIRFALTAIKGVGTSAIEAILAERDAHGPFKSLYDFMKRIDTQKVGKKMIEYLAEVGAFDFTGWNRSELLFSVEPMHQLCQKEQKEKQRGERSLFALLETEADPFMTPPKEAPLLSKMVILKREKELLGFYLTGHPLDSMTPYLQRLSAVSLDILEKTDKPGLFRSCFVIEEVTTRVAARSGKKFALLKVGDGKGHLEIAVFSDLYEQSHSLLVEGQLIYAIIQVEKEEEQKAKIQCRYLNDLTKVNEEMIQECDRIYDRLKMQTRSFFSQSKGIKSLEKAGTPSQKKALDVAPSSLKLKLNAEKMSLSHVLELKSLFRAFPGKMALELEFWVEEGSIGTVFIDSLWGVDWTEELEQSLRRIGILMHE